MRALGVLAVAAGLALSACDGGDDGGDGQVRGATDGMVPPGDATTPPADTGPVDTGSQTPAPEVCPVAFDQLINLNSSSTLGGTSHLCFACVPIRPYEPLASGCLWNSGGRVVVLCVTDATFATAGCH